VRRDSPDLARRALAEALAAFALVFAGCGAIIANEQYHRALGAVGTSLVFGLVIMVMVYATGHLSGAHINPAVTIAFTLTRHFPGREAVAYVTAQVLGATAAALVLLGVWTDRPAHLGATLPTVAAGSAFLYEAVLTAFLMFVIMAVATDTRAVGAAAAIAIGGVIGLDALFGGPVTGASMNPARSFGPALVSGEWRDFWVYVTGPIAGAALGAFAYQFVRGAAQPAAGVAVARGSGSAPSPGELDRSGSEAAPAGDPASASVRSGVNR
jgi:aquaporin NIP